MICKVIIGNILDSRVQTLVNTVNTVGIMGKGIALEFKKRFPDMFKDYTAKCERGEVELGKPYLYKTLFIPWIINFPTKQHWRSTSKIEDIRSGLDYLIKHLNEWGIKSLAVPPLGCGNGQLEWREVGPMIYLALDPLRIPVEMYAPFGTPARQLTAEFLKNASNAERSNGWGSHPKFNPHWLVLVEILNKLEKHPYHTPIGRTIFQKIGYIATAQGLPTGFHFSQKSFGPFSAEMKKAITILANNNLIVEQQKGSMFRVKTGIKYGDAREKYADLLQNFKNIIAKTTDLFTRMTTDQAEIATTIFYSAQVLREERQNRDLTECDIFDYVMEWKKKRRPPLDKKEVASSIRNLAILKWLNVKYCEDLPVYEEF